MTREEEINKAAFDYSDALEFPNPETRFGYEDIEFAFQSGAEWADKHHINVWNDASEEPEHNCTIVYVTKNNKIGTLKRADKSRWNWYKEKYSILMWAYIADILPKGGEHGTER